MKFLWSNNLVHRDLKPQNLLLTSDDDDAQLKIGESSHVVAAARTTVTAIRLVSCCVVVPVWIADFGFARQLAVTALAETLCGSPLYMVRALPLPR